MKHNRGKLLIITSKRPSVTGLNCRLLTSFDGQTKNVLGIHTINTEVTIHIILTGRRDGDEWRGGTVGIGFDRGI